MPNNLMFYIDGQWVVPAIQNNFKVIDPATEEAFTEISLGSFDDVHRAVLAAKRAFSSFSKTSKSERLELLVNILAEYKLRYEDIARAISQEMGAPLSFSLDNQAYAGQAHLEAAIAALEQFEPNAVRGTTLVTHEPIGVCALITPWNWPMNQLVTKVAPALAAGCTVVLKPSEIAPISSMIFAEIIDAAGVPAGVFNLVNGNGQDVGQVLAEHPDVDMVSFTGSTRAGVLVAKAAADTVKRVAQELGGKSANIILEDADLQSAIHQGVMACFANSGQSCDAPTRMLVPAKQLNAAVQIASAAADSIVLGSQFDVKTTHGPVISDVQYQKIQALIQTGIDEGADLVCGGLGKPMGLERGYFVKPTIFAGVKPEMTLAREEVFGPVLVIMPYETEEQAIEIANDSVYGLAAYVQSTNVTRAREVALQLRAGSIYINYPEWDVFAPFGGYKQSGNGREYADWGLHDFMEVKGVIGWG